MPAKDMINLGHEETRIFLRQTGMTRPKMADWLDVSIYTIAMWARKGKIPKDKYEALLTLTRQAQSAQPLEFKFCPNCGCNLKT